MSVREEEEAAHIGNWRTAPYNRRAFSHVRELIPTANIAADPATTVPLGRNLIDLTALSFKLREGGTTTLKDFLDQTFTDGFMVVKRGRIATEWWRDEDASTNPHVIFSVSKSITAMLAGILNGRGLLDPDAPVTRYIPEAKESAYGDASLRHVLDMTVSLDFEENYLDPNSPFMLYREAMGWNIPRPGLPYHLRGFLLTLKKGPREHGERFSYMSPNTDLLGWVCERAGGAPLADLLRDLIWRPMGAAHDAYVTVDPRGASRAAGGICVRLEDLVRFGEMIRCEGMARGREIVPSAWITDMREHGDRVAWQKGDMATFLANGKYRSKWYSAGNDSGAFMGIGIHGQWLYIDPKAKMVIAKQSSQALPVDWAMDFIHLDVFDGIARHVEK